MMTKSLRRVARVALFPIVVFVATAGCGSLSASSKSSSKIISSPIQSSSASSPDDDYQEDVRDFTAAYYKSNGRPEDLRRKISDLAEKHGVSDWEESKTTFRGIGEGLGKGGARQVEVDAFKANLTSNDQQEDWIQEGYESTK